MVRGSPEKRYDPRGSQKIKKKIDLFSAKKTKIFDFFNLLYFLLPGFIFDQKIEFLSEFRWQSALLK